MPRSDASAGPWLRRALFTWWLGAAVALACSGRDEHPGAQGDLGIRGGGPVVAPPCSDGAVQECSVTLSEHDGVLSCYHGAQICEGGRWSACSGGSSTLQAAPIRSSAPGQSGLLALTVPEECTDNPCDPFCQTYGETPLDPITATPTDPTYDWEQGSLADFPPGLVNKGLVEPCESGSDCQFNMRCESPAQDECDHSVCATGAALEDDCSDCAALVCAADDTCCVGPPDDVAGCNHDPCVTGKGLSNTCNSCVKKVCNAQPSCCVTSPSNNNNWTASCVAAVASVCGNSCSCQSGETLYGGHCYYYETTNRDWDDSLEECEDRGTGWSLVSIETSAENTMLSNWNSSQEKFIGFEENSNQWTWTGNAGLGTWSESTGTSTPAGMYTSWQSGHPAIASDPDCAYLNNGSTQWVGVTACNSSSSSNKRDSVCEGPTSVMVNGVITPPIWDADCVAKVATACDAKCNAADPTDDTGSCIPWYPGETDDDCAGVDLAIGVPCDDSIPVCNHGNVDVLPPIEVVHFPANSNQYPNCAPDQTHPQMVSCTVTETIPAGECVSIDDDDCVDQDGDPQPFNGNREIMINPSGSTISTAGGPVTECSCLDNWSLYSNGSDCGSPVCFGGNTAATQVTIPVDIVIIVDNSPSMDNEIEQIQARIHTDLAEILAASNLDYRVILVSRFGDVDIPVGTSSCPICIGSPLGGNACSNPALETLVTNPPNFYHFSAEIESFDAWCQLLYGFNHADEVGTTDASAVGAGVARAWTALAPGGWGSWLREEAFKTFLVITDDDVECNDYGYNFDDTPTCNGFPHNCHNLTTQVAPANSVAAGDTAAAAFDVALRTLSPDQFGTAADRKYIWHSIVNVRNNPAGATVPWAATDAIQTQMCTPTLSSIIGAGTGYQGLSRLTGGLRYPICQNANFDAMFNAIAEEVIETAAASCEFELGDPSTFNPDSASVSYTTTAGTSVALTEAASAAACGTSTTQWYYDDPSNPGTLTLCPSTCDAVQADDGAQVWVELGCPLGGAGPTVYTEVYEAACDSDRESRWTFLGYDTTTTSDGTVSFRVRTASSEAELASATWLSAATASSSQPDCNTSAPSGSCPVDLYELLGSTEAKRHYLELEITVTPSSSGDSPSVEDWQVSYSCPPGE